MVSGDYCRTEQGLDGQYDCGFWLVAHVSSECLHFRAAKRVRSQSTDLLCGVKLRMGMSVKYFPNRHAAAYVHILNMLASTKLIHERNFTILVDCIPLCPVRSGDTWFLENNYRLTNETHSVYISISRHTCHISPVDSDCYKDNWECIPCRKIPNLEASTDAQVLQ